jgi:hypothetical protein
MRGGNRSQGPLPSGGFHGIARHAPKRIAFEKSLPENEQFAFLPKPFTLAQLVAAVKETMPAQ